MPVEMIGWIAPRVSSEIIPAEGPAFSADVVAETARIHETRISTGSLLAIFRMRRMDSSLVRTRRM